MALQQVKDRNMLSIVIPVYNGEKYIAETLEHIQASSYTDFEILIVNDGSKDQSESIIRKLIQEDQRIKYYYKENGGIVSARNYGLDKASGKYICFVDQDDMVMPYMFEHLINDIEQNHADFAQGGVAQSSDENTFEEEVSAYVLEEGTEEFNHAFGSLILRGDVIKASQKIDCNIWNKIYRLDFLRENKIIFKTFLDYEDDWIFVINAMKHAKTVTIRKQVVYIWRTNLESESRNRIAHDKYLDDFYVKHCALRAFLLDALKEATVDQKLYVLYENELQKETLLWGLSNETGKGIENRTLSQSTAVMKEIVKHEREYGVKRGMLKRPLPISIYGQHGIKKAYYVFRDLFLTILLLNHMEGLAVVLNKKVLHGRWHN